jgi:predicted cupin superfamily sugar epimerase
MINKQTAAYWVEKLEMQKHPEGGYYKEVFRSDNIVLRPASLIDRNACTSIYYLLEGEDYSGFHRLQSDEIWYFHKGVPIHIHVINKTGQYNITELSEGDEGSFSFVVKAGDWFAAEIPSKSGFTLVSCAVAPGFDFAEFEMAAKNRLTALYPQHEKFCRC